VTKEEQETGLVAAAALGVVGLLYHREIVATARDIVSRGARLTDTTLNDRDPAWIEWEPADLAAQAESVFGQPFARAAFSSLGVYALARMSRSEAGPRDGDDSRRVRMHVALNDVAELGWELPRLFLFSKYDGADGHFGEQRGRRYSTARDPYAGDILLAWQAIDDHAAGTDPTGGAVKFVDADSMGKQKGSTTWPALVERWGKEGLTPYNVQGLGENFYVFRREA
jgi:hypothetical protein